MEQWTGSKLGKEYIKAVYCHPAYLTYMQNTPCEMLNWMKQTGITIAGRNISNLRHAVVSTLMAESEEVYIYLKLKFHETLITLIYDIF